MVVRKNQEIKKPRRISHGPYSSTQQYADSILDHLYNCNKVSVKIKVTDNNFVERQMDYPANIGLVCKLNSDSQTFTKACRLLQEKKRIIILELPKAKKGEKRVRFGFRHHFKPLDNTGKIPCQRWLVLSDEEQKRGDKKDYRERLEGQPNFGALIEKLLQVNPKDPPEKFIEKYKELKDSPNPLN